MVGPSSSWTRRCCAALSLALLTGLAACEQSTAPAAGNRLATQTALADYKAMQDVFATSGWAGFQALGGRSPLASTAAAGAVAGLPGLSSRHSGRDFAAGFLRELAATRAGDATLARTVISPVHLGRTLVYDPALDRYVIDPGRTGAPASGTRFIIYEVDAAGRPIVAREIGHADLLDEGRSTGNAITLRLIVVERGRVILDYRTRADLRADAGEIGVEGFVQDAQGTRLAFTIDVAARQVAGETRIDADFELAVTPRGFTAVGKVRGVKEGEGGDGTISLTLRHGENSLRVEMAERDQQLDGAIQLNGNPFVTVTGSARSPTLRGRTGQPLTEQELLVVLAIVKMSDDVFDLVEDLVKPVEKLLLLGWVL